MSVYLHYGMIALRLCILLVSALGWLSYLQKKVRMEFALGILLTGIGSVMFAAGIFHVLREAAWLVFFSGLWLLVREIRCEPDIKSGLRAFAVRFYTPGVVYFALMAVFFLLLLFGSEFTHYDNFSHWGVVAKVISEKDMFPNPADTNVTFTSYPLGSAAFIYFITEIAGAAPEWLQMWAQAVLMAGILVSLFAFGGGIICSLSAGAGIVILLAGNTSFVDLLVDTLLPVIAIGGMAFCVYYKEELENKIWFVIPYAVFLVSVKNSGALFAVLILLYAIGKVPKTRENLKKLAVVAVSPMAVLFFWNRHVEQLFDDGAVSKHAMRLDNFQQILADKTPQDLAAIVEAFWQETIKSQELIVYLLLISAMILLFRKAVLKKNCRELCEILLLTGGFCVMYQVGLLGMYILTMPLEEALMMAGYGRYHDTAVVFAAGMVLLAVIRELDVCRTRKYGTVFSVILAVLALLLTASTVEPDMTYYSRQSLENTERAKFDRLIEDYGLLPEDRYLILVSEERKDGGYLHWLSYYLLDPEEIVIADVSYITEKMEENCFNFVVMFDDTEVNRNYLESQFGFTEEVGYIAGKPLH